MLKILRDSELLPKRSTPVLEVTQELRRFASELFAKMQLSNGLGLAAPQVGRYVCLIVFDCVAYTYNSMDSGYMFNPEIIESSEQTKTDKEGCLSYPGEFCSVTRNLNIVVKYVDLSNKEVVRSYSGLAARIIQHEIDHLNGVTMKDRELENGRST
jgi:peptide deformylase